MGEDGAANDGPMAWCVVANVAAETYHGEAGRDVRQGLEHFAAGAKVWVLPPQWGDGGADVMVVGHHRGRGRRRLARLVVGRHHLTGFRVRGVYGPAIHRELTRPSGADGPPPRQWESRDEAERMAGHWTARYAAQAGVRRPRQRAALIDVLATLAGSEPSVLLPHNAWHLAHSWFGDPPDPASTLGDLLRDQYDVTLIAAVLGPLRTVVDDLGPPDRHPDYTLHRAWPSVARAADRAHARMTGPS